MKFLKIFAVLLLCFSGFLAYMGHSAANTSVLESIRVPVCTSGRVTSNYKDPSAQYKPIFENDEVTIVDSGGCKIEFVTDTGANVSATFDYSFDRLPDDRIISVVYDKTNPMRFSVKDFDRNDYLTAIFLYAFAVMSGIIGMCAALAAVILSVAEERKNKQKERGNDTQDYTI